MPRAGDLSGNKEKAVGLVVCYGLESHPTVLKIPNRSNSVPGLFDNYNLNAQHGRLL